jgi:iron complex outermembrane recepter protein
MGFTTDRRSKTQKTPPTRSQLRHFPRLLAFAAGLTLATMPAYGTEPSSADSDGGFYGFNDSLPEVLTTTRLRQPKTRVPGSTTVIEGDMIRDLGIMSLVDVFRLVPGMVVAYVGSSTPVTTYHGTVHYEQRRMQVLVDGRTAHRATLSDMDWQTMPVPLELIERIEVSRGPNSAAYGINAFLGTINIITRDPADTAGAELRVVRGSREYLRTFASVGDADQVYDWRLAFEKRQSGGFDYLLDDDPVTGEEVKFPFNDGHDINVFNYDSRVTVSPGFNAEFSGGVVDGINEEDLNKGGELGPTEDPDIDVRDYYLQTRLNFTPSEQHFYHLQVSYERFNRRQRWPISIPETAVECLRNGTLVFWRENRDICFPEPAPGATPLTAQINADAEDSRLEIELQDTIIFNRDLKLVTGAGYREDIYRSETYFNGRGSNYQSRVFGNVEYTPVRWLTFNGGGNWERTTTTDESYFSPRVAANFVFNPNHALRFVYSKAVRTPDGFEQNPDYGFTLRNVEPDQYSDFEGYRINNTAVWDNPSLVTLGRELEEERITSREISYFGQFPAGTALFTLEVRAFRDQLRDMISGVIQFDDWTIDNNVDMNQKGFEVEASMEFPGTTFRTSYGYLDQDDWYNGPQILDDDGNVDSGEKQYNVDLLGRLSVRHSGSVALIQDLTAGFLGSAAFYWADEFSRGSHAERLDLRLAKRIFQPRYTAEIALTMQHFMNEDPDLGFDNYVENQNQFFIEAGIRF